VQVIMCLKPTRPTLHWVPFAKFLWNTTTCSLLIYRQEKERGQGRRKAKAKKGQRVHLRHKEMGRQKGRQRQRRQRVHLKQRRSNLWWHHPQCALIERRLMKTMQCLLEEKENFHNEYQLIMTYFARSSVRWD
jgi:hypothetical protein